MKLGETKYDNKETGCCARIDPKAWDGKRVVLEDRSFMKDHVVSFLHIPLNMGAVMKRVTEKAESAAAYTENPFFLFDDNSLWGLDVYLPVDKDVPNAEMVKLSGTYLTKVFEGPYKNIGSWIKEMHAYVGGKGSKVKKLYFYYTACPKCAKHFGKNYVVIFAEI